MSTLRLTTISNQTGSASVPSDTVINGSAKAWVNFNGTGVVAIRAAFNVSSITDNGTGDYTVNFSTAFVDANYVTVGSCDRVAAAGDCFVSLYAVQASGALVAPTTTAARVNTSRFDNSDVDVTYVCVSFFR